MDLLSLALSLALPHHRLRHGGQHQQGRDLRLRELPLLRHRDRPHLPHADL